MGLEQQHDEEHAVVGHPAMRASRAARTWPASSSSAHVVGGVSAATPVAGGCIGISSSTPGARPGHAAAPRRPIHTASGRTATPPEQKKEQEKEEVNRMLIRAAHLAVVARPDHRHSARTLQQVPAKY